MKTSIYIGASLDGFIARENGDLDWLLAYDGQGDEDYGYKAFMETVDRLVMGRNTYEKVLEFGKWPYGSKPVVVLSSRPLVIPASIAGHVEVMSGSPADIVSALERRGARHLYIDGGNTIQRFLSAGLIDRIIITHVPVLIGNGIRLFGPVPHDIKLRHVASHDFSTGLVQSEYLVVR